ncbi:MAG TPA: hypothetical protein VLI05_01615 [Candidatus Saccharimonadia bacterium]|nr:hypothetical protein [Candidatus Saccharimonadia bacterium]
MTSSSDVPQPHTEEINGHQVTVTYTADRYTEGCLKARVAVPVELVDAAEQLRRVRVDPRASSWDTTYLVVDGSSKELLSSPSPYWLGTNYRDYLKKQAEERAETAIREQLEQLRAKVETLRELDRCTPGLSAALQQCEETARGKYQEGPNYASTQAAIRRVERLVAEIETSFIEVVVRELVAGAYHQWRYHNNEVRTQLVALWIRSGGNSLIQLLDDTAMTQIYRERLAQAQCMDDVWRAKLGIDLEDYAPRWLREDPELELAPARITVTTRSGSHQLLLSYYLKPDKEEQVPTATARLPLKVYEGVATMPTLPYGIDLCLELTVGETVVVKGIAGEELTGRVKRYRGARRRGDIISTPGGRRHKPVEVTDVPSWHVGQVRWR